MWVHKHHNPSVLRLFPFNHCLNTSLSSIINSFIHIHFYHFLSSHNFLFHSLPTSSFAYLLSALWWILISLIKIRQKSLPNLHKHSCMSTLWINHNCLLTFVSTKFSFTHIFYLLSSCTKNFTASYVVVSFES